MRATAIQPTSVERVLGRDELVVSKTDAKGRITYVNEVFCRMAAAREPELLGQPHSIIRHPDMPRAVFRLMWEQIAKRRELFAYVKNMGMDGAYYWVFAHVTATGAIGEAITGYHSNRRAPDREALTVIEPLYRRLRELETADTSTAGMDAATALLTRTLDERGMSYDEFVWSITS